jgi:site-specific DNA-methyltransferase (adenine-specific)
MIANYKGQQMTKLIPAFVGMPEVNKVYNCDALTLLKALPDASVDLVFIDPPYGNNNGVDDLAAARARDKVKGGRQRGEILAIANDGEMDWKALMPPVLKEINRVLNPVGCCCCCIGGGGGASGNMSTYAQLDQWLHQYHEFFNAVIWDKSKRGNGMGWRYRRNYEFVMVSHKRGGKLAWNDNRPAQPNVINFAPTKNEHHPTEKPLELVKFFILNHTQPGAVVLDCFAGSGTTGLACLELGRDYILADIEPKHCTTAISRTSAYTPSFMNLLQDAG